MIQVEAIPAFDDNYIWCLTAPGSDAAVVVDPGDAAPVLDHLQSNRLRPVAILITHKHNDHVGGVSELIANTTALPVYGPAHEPIRTLTHRLEQGDKVELPELQATFDVLDVPGHTEGHIAYFGHGMLFSGDTLFAGGCGRVFSGTYQQLHDSLMKIAALPDNTLIYCAHEYTLANLGFAQWVEPHNEALADRVVKDRARRQSGTATVPSLLALEKATNPFLRTVEAKVVAAAEKYTGKPLQNGAEVFTAIRTWKDREYD